MLPSYCLTLFPQIITKITWIHAPVLVVYLNIDDASNRPINIHAEVGTDIEQWIEENGKPGDGGDKHLALACCSTQLGGTGKL